MKKNKGFTLTEVMIVVAILGIVGSMGAVLLKNFTRYWRLNNARSSIQRDVRRCLSLMNRNLRQARATTVTIDQASGQPPWSRISFNTISDDQLIYYQSGTNLQMSVNGTVFNLSKILRTLKFTYPYTDNDTIIGINICMEEQTYDGGKKALQLSIEKVSLMN